MTISTSDLHRLSLETLKELETESGILASARNELFGCIFGRDSLISVLNFLTTYTATRDPYLLAFSKKILIHLATLQGSEINIQNGEEPGKIIHEFRLTDHGHLTQKKEWPWHVCTDGSLRNYDTADATPLFLWATHRFFQQSRDDETMKILLPTIERALDWLLVYGDSNGDGLIDYQFHPQRTAGGLRVQGWMDSSESLFHEDGEPVTYPIAPVEVQGYAYHALSVWSEYFEKRNSIRAGKLKEKARDIKKSFHDKFILKTSTAVVIGCGIDGAGKLIASQRSSIGHLLWTASRQEGGGVIGGLLDSDYAHCVAERLLQSDLFEPAAGIRTLSKNSRNFSVNSYHNGAIWPHDTSIVAEGLENYGFHIQAQQVRHALLSAYDHFQTPLELFCYDTDFSEFQLSSGQVACRKQAWSAASLLKETSRPECVDSVSPATSQDSLLYG